MNPHLAIVSICSQIVELRDSQLNTLRNLESSSRPNPMLAVHYEAKAAAYQTALDVIRTAAVGVVQLEQDVVRYHDPAPRYGRQDIDNWSKLPMPEPSLLQRFVLWISRLF